MHVYVYVCIVCSVFLSPFLKVPPLSGSPPPLNLVFLVLILEYSINS